MLHEISRTVRGIKPHSMNASCGWNSDVGGCCALTICKVMLIVQLLSLGELNCCWGNKSQGVESILTLYLRVMLRHRFISLPNFSKRSERWASCLCTRPTPLFFGLGAHLSASELPIEHWEYGADGLKTVAQAAYQITAEQLHWQQYLSLKTWLRLTSKKVSLNSSNSLQERKYHEARQQHLHHQSRRLSRPL